MNNMIRDQSSVDLVGQAKKSAKTLPKNAAASFALFFMELKTLGPYRSNWPNYTKTKGVAEDYHCHISCLRTGKSRNFF